MLNQLKKNITINQSIVDGLLKTRQRLLIAYYNLIGFKPHKKIYEVIDEKTITIFCSYLLDYLSSGHFYVYTRLLIVMFYKKIISVLQKLLLHYKIIHIV